VVHLANGGRRPYRRGVDHHREHAGRCGAARASTNARAALVGAELAPMRQERLSREKDLVEKMAIAPNYLATFDALAGISLHGLRDDVRGVPARHAVDVGRRAPGVPQARARHHAGGSRRAPTPWR